MPRRPFVSLDPLAYRHIVGSTFANHDHQPLIVIGDRSWTRWQLGRLGCPHPSAATRVQRVIRTLKIRSVEEFIDRASEFGRFRDIGVTSYWVVLALVADCGRSIGDVHRDDRSFHAIHREAMRVGEAGGDDPPKRRRSQRSS